MDTYIEQFRAKIRGAGITPPDDVCCDGQIHRFSTNGKPTDDAGWYCLHQGIVPAGAFGDWRQGISQSWKADVGRKLTRPEESELRSKQAEIRSQRAAEDVELRSDAARRAAEIFAKAEPAALGHPYLQAKRVQSHGLRTSSNQLLVPVSVEGAIASLQFISADGQKRFLPGGTTKGGCFEIGPVDISPTICVAEGYATGASIYEATKLPVVIAFHAGNLMPVAQALHRRHPDATLVICADDDVATEGNPGMTKATEAASAVGGLLAIPQFGSDRPAKATDFNDQAKLLGLDSLNDVFDQLLSAAPTDVETSDVTPVAGVQLNAGLDSRVTATVTPEHDDVAFSDTPKAEEDTGFVVFDDWWEANGVIYRPGVWLISSKVGKGNALPIPTQQLICAPLHVDAVTSDLEGNHFGRRLRFLTTLKKWREWAMPMEMLSGRGDELRANLLSMGLEIDVNSHKLLIQYLQSARPKRRIYCATQVGWFRDSFVMPDAVIGSAMSNVIFQSADQSHHDYGCEGNLSGWKDEIGARAIGNPLLMLAISAAFAGPLIAKCKGESGGIHLVGDSSTGKTTAIEAACSVWGGPSFKRSWRATGNGIEGAAALFNDNLLALDEISECDPREIGAIIYALGNGTGKQRASRTGVARKLTRWRCMVLSSGERSIGTSIAESGQRVKAGQAVRLLDVPVNRRFGAWDNLHGLATGNLLSDALKRAASTHYGVAGRAFLERLSRDTRSFSDEASAVRANAGFNPADAEGQDRRAAARFALIAQAGELATEYGITGWQPGDAIKAAVEAFRTWRDLRGGGNDERRQILDRIRSFIEKHGDSRFSDANDDRAPVRERAGWWTDEFDGDRIYLFNKDGMREALSGFDFKRGLDVLQDVGVLVSAKGGGERSKPMRVGNRTVRIYQISNQKLEAADTQPARAGAGCNVC